MVETRSEANATAIPGVWPGARRVMAVLPHVLVAGDGAAPFAKEMAVSSEDFPTQTNPRIWNDGVRGELEPTLPDAEWLGVCSGWQSIPITSGVW
jgi:isoaspartyl peptidase/L-asparaginase-like protein (Ntn-hydrolase superfamily)